MRLPTIQGIIDRRVLVNYRVDADVVSRILPSPFKPKLANGYAMAGICLIRLKHIRPSFIPFPVGIRSENAAHRFAVVWERDGRKHEGVFIPRRDSSSRLNTLAGGRIFAGEHHHARFDVCETNDELKVSFVSDDGHSRLNLRMRFAENLPANSVFASLDEASRFFEAGSLGYSVTSNPSRYEGLELKCKSWSVRSLEIESIQSSYFDDPSRFPPGSAALDCALLMRNVQHEWHARGSICCENELTASPARLVTNDQ